MISAVYARKSNDQSDVADEEKSVTRQIEHAKAYAAQQGWTVADEHVYVDDAVSGAEFERRAGFVRLMTAVAQKPRPSFDVLLMMESARIGREQIELAYALKQVITAGIRVFDYMDGRELKLDTPTDKLMLAVATFADELERDKARQRTYDTMIRKAKAGHVTGGRVFGYDNVPVEGHVERRINAAEAAVIRRIFEWCAQGWGFRRIAHILNAESALSPRSQQDRPRGWSPSTVRDVLHRQVYVGQIIWGKSRKRDTWGRRQSRRAERLRAPDDWTRVHRPDLQIIPDALWESVQARLQATRRAYIRDHDGRLHGRPLSGIAARYLLTGLLTCGRCRGSLTIRTRSHGTGRLALYQCLTHVTKGPTVCPNRVAVRQRDAEQAVLAAVEADLLRPEVVTAAIEASLADLHPDRPDTLAAQQAALQAQITAIEVELRRLADAIAAGAPMPTLLAAVQDREVQRTRLQQERANLEALVSVRTLDRPRLLRDLRDRVTDWQGLLDRHPQQARTMLQKLLVGRLVFTPSADGTEVEFTGEGRLDPFVTGLVGTENGQPKAGVSPSGHADAALLARAFLLVQSYAAVKLRALGHWEVRGGVRL